MIRRLPLCLGKRRCRTQCRLFFQAEDGIRDDLVTGVQTCALPISHGNTTGLTAASLTAQQQFLTTAQAAQTEVDNLTTMVAVSGMGVKGTDLLTRSTKEDRKSVV